MTESELSLWPAAGSGEIPGLCCAGKGCEQVRFLLLHIVLDESPGISKYLGQGLEQMQGEEGRRWREITSQILPVSKLFFALE